MRTLVFRIAVAVAALLVVSGAVAQSGSREVRVKIPFPFLVGNQHMPSGRYRVAPAGNGVLQMSGIENTRCQLFLSVHAVESRIPQPPKLVFHRYGDSYFLSEVWNGTGNIGRQLPKSKGEQEIVAGKIPTTSSKGEIALVRPER